MNRSQVTGLLSGGEMSLNAVPPLFSTTLDITAGSGQVVDYSDPTSVILTPVSWDAYNASSTNGVYIPTPANLANDGTYVLAIDSSGTISEIVITAISTQDTSDKIMIGAYVANSGVVVAIFTTPFNTGYGGETTATDFIRNVIGPANIEGNVFGANGANLNLDLVGGRVFLIGSNFRTNTKTPDELSISSGSAVEFARIYRSALPETDIIVETGDATDIDPDYYDDHSGTLQTVANNDWSVQVIYIVVDGSFLVAYGQETFNTQTLAEQAVINGTLVYDELKQLQLQVRRMFLVVKQGATNLSDPTQAAFFTDGCFSWCWRFYFWRYLWHYNCWR